jgi:hypothetical protein
MPHSRFRKAVSNRESPAQVAPRGNQRPLTRRVSYVREDSCLVEARHVHAFNDLSRFRVGASESKCVVVLQFDRFIEGQDANGKSRVRNGARQFDFGWPLRG